MISKELLSQVLGEEIYHIYDKSDIDENYICYMSKVGRNVDINIYEVAHKCKEWALTQIVDKRIQSYGCAIQSWSTTSGCGKARILVLDKLFSASSEPQVIIDACEYIRIGVDNGYN